MQILGLLGFYFDAAVVEVRTFLLLFRLALAILCQVSLYQIFLYYLNSTLFLAYSGRSVGAVGDQ